MSFPPRPFLALALLSLLLLPLRVDGQSASWSTPVRLNVPSGEVRHPSIAAARGGKVYAIWQCTNQRPSSIKAQLFFAVLEGSNWSPAVAITDTGRADWSPDIAVDTAANPHVVWADYATGDIFYWRFDGTSWSSPLNLSHNPGESYSPRLAIDHRNHIHVVWHDAESGVWRVYYKMFDGSSWSNTENLSDSLHAAAYPRIAIDGMDGVHLTFHSATPPRWYNDIFYRRRDAGSWSPVVRITSDSLESILPAVAVGADGRRIIVWSQHVGALNKWPPDIRICMSESDGGSWTLPTDISDASESHEPAIVAGRNNQVHVLWSRLIRGQYRSIILAARRMAGAWTEEETVSTSMDPVSSGESMVGIDSSWNQHAIWGATDSGIYYSRREEVVGVVPTEDHLPLGVSLSPNYPNPFNATTRILYSLAEGGEITLKVFDLIGREVQVLQAGMQEAGHHSVVFEARGLASGLYFYRLHLPTRILTRTMHLLR